MLSNYLNNIYEKYIIPNLTDDEIRYNYLIKIQLINFIKEYPYVNCNPTYRGYDAKNELIFFDKEYKIGFTYDSDQKTIWFVRHDINDINIVESLFYGHVYDIIELVKNISSFDINDVNFFQPEYDFYIDAVDYLKKNYVL